MLEIRAREVKDANGFIAYCRQQLGLPAPQQKDYKVVGRLAKAIFDAHPGTDWSTLVSVADWCKGQRRRFTSPGHVVSQFRYAYAARAVEIPELQDPVDMEVQEALTVETDPAWRARLIRAQGATARREVLDEWKRSQLQLLAH